MKRWPGVALLVLSLALPRLATAQRWETLTVKRQIDGVDTLHVHVRYGEGTFTLAAAPDSVLYDIHLRFDAARVRPLRRYDPRTHTLTVGVDSMTGHSITLGGHSAHRSGNGALALGIAPGIPVTLHVELGATESTLDLGRLSLAGVSVAAGASDASLDFGTPNPGRVRDIHLAAGAADLKVHQLGNARADSVFVDAGVGGVDLDLSGAWSGAMALKIQLAAGSATVRVPRDAGVRVRMTKLLSGLEGIHLVKRNGAFYSANWASAPRRLTVDASSALGTVRLVRLAQ